jgi:large subunit ribosomal protein L4
MAAVSKKEKTKEPKAIKVTKAPKAKKIDGAKIEYPVLSADGKKAGTVTLDPTVFGVKTKKNLVHQVVRWQRAKKRAGTHSTQTRAEMSGGGKKPWKQKGTGNARAGSNTSPLWVGGGIAHGPKPRSYEFRMNRKEKAIALAGVLSERCKTEKLYILESFGLNKFNTKAANTVLKNIGVGANENTMVVLATDDVFSIRSLRNIDRVEIFEPMGVNLFSVLKAKNLVVSKAVLADLETRIKKQLGAAEVTGAN